VSPTSPRVDLEEGTTNTTFGSLSPAEQAILSGRPVQDLDPNGRLEKLLTPEAITTLFSTNRNTRKEVRDKIIAAIKREIEGPLCLRYVTRYQTEFLKARHSIAERQATSETNTSHPSTTIVAVDGSYKVLDDGTHIASGACAYIVTDYSTNPPTEEVHIVYCTFDGEQDVTNGEISGLSLALQWLADKQDLQIGWDHLNGVKQAHYQIPGTTCRGRHEGMTAECLPAYHHNPHMATALALLEKAGLDNRRRTIEHTSAHGLDQELENQKIQIKPTWQEKTRTYVVNHSTLKEIRRVMDGMEARNGHQSDNLVMLNALADWGAKQVTIHGKKDGPHLLRPALTPGNYMVTTPDGDIQRADEAFLRKGVAKRIRRQLLESCMARKPGKYDIKGNTKGLWERETEHMLSRPTWPESLPRLLV
jgi:hypothetical protein